MSNTKHQTLFKIWMGKPLWRRLSQQSLTVKLVVTVSFVVGIIVLVGTAILMNITNKALAETSVSAALYQTQLLKGKLIETMLGGDPRHEKLESLFKSEKTLKQLGEVNIFNPGGEVRFSSIPENVGRQIEVSLDQVDRFTPDDALIESGDLNETGHIRIVHPIRGGAQCAVCHQNAVGELVGGIELFVPLAPIFARLAANRFFFVFAALAIIVFGAFLIRWLVHRIVKQPIKKLIHVMEKAEKGELDVRTRIKEDPDLCRLAESFNSMVQGIQSAQRKIEQQYQKELAQSNRLASLGQIISNVSHEIKNPLAAINSALHVLRNEFQSADGQEVFNELMLQIDRIERTVNNLLRYARQAPPRFEKCLIADPIHNALHLAEPSLSRNSIKSKMDCAVDQLAVWGDSGQLEQIFLNLFLNSANAMPDGGSLRIGIRSVSEGEFNGFRDGQKEAGLVVEVEDTGSGIRPEDLPRIFEPFFTTRKGGTGLGLSVVKGIVEAHNGMILVDSNFGEGTKVRVYFPFSRVSDEAIIESLH